MRPYMYLWLGCCLATVSWGAESVETAATHYQTGLAYERLGRLEESYTELQLACVLDANDARMALALGLVALRLARYDVAQRSLEHSIVLDANSSASYYHLALLYEQQNAQDRALDSWNRFLELTPDESLKLQARKHIQYLESHKSSG
jgi:tetratricopeptide (TPR) repeat protein